MEIIIGTYLKKSSLQKTWPFLAKHLSVNLAPQSRHVRHLACQHLSRTLRTYLSRIASWQPPHFGIEAATFNEENAQRMETRRKIAKLSSSSKIVETIVTKVTSTLSSWYVIFSFRQF